MGTSGTALAAKGPHSITWDELDTFQFTTYGSVYIFATDVLLYPADLLTTRLQADKNYSQYYKTRGHAGGFVPATVGSFPGQYLYYLSYEWTKQQLLKLTRHLRLGESLEPGHGHLDHIFSSSLAGLAAEMVSGIAYLPTDIISQRLQIERKVNFLHSRYQFKGSWAIIKHIWKNEGVGGFYRGYGPYVVVFGPNSAIWWSSYEVFKKVLFSGLTRLERGVDRCRDCYLSLKQRRSSFWPLSALGLEVCSSSTDTQSLPGRSAPLDQRAFLLPGKNEINSFVSGALGGTVACLVTNPLDVARTRLQLLEAAHHNERQALRRGFTTLLANIYREEGIAGWYKGVKPRVLVKIPGSAIAFLGYEWLKRASLKGDNVKAWQATAERNTMYDQLGPSPCI